MPRILVVEDQPENVEILERLLTRKGHEVLVADSRDGAVAAVAHEMPDLILMDINIPNSPGEEVNKNGGVEAVHLIKAAEASKAIPIIALTASAMMDQKQCFLQAGCDAVQTKPFEFGPLLAAIEAALIAGK